jgi:hypothetical protein
MNLQIQESPLQLWKWIDKSTCREQRRRHLSFKPSQDKLRWESKDATHIVLARICLLSSSSKRLTRTSTSRTRMTRATTSWHASSDHQMSKINGCLSAVSRKATTTVTRQHPKIVEDEASMQTPMKFLPWSSRRSAYC